MAANMGTARLLRAIVPLGAIALLGAIVPLGCAGSGASADFSDDSSASEPSACRLSVAGPVAPVDIAVAIDVSLSTRRPSGADIDGDGEVGVFRDGGSSDAGDSLLAAELAGVRSLLRSAEPLDAWFSVVTFSGGQTVEWKPSERLVRLGHATVRSPLSDDIPALETVLDGVFARGGRGRTDFAAGIGTASRALLVAPKISASARRVVFFVSDSPTPVILGPTGTFPRSDLHVAIAAKQAADAGVVFYTFGIGDAAKADTPHALSLIAGFTGGNYWAVEDPRDLHCHLLRALEVATLE